jgi:hypothetical protein
VFLHKQLIVNYFHSTPGDIEGKPQRKDGAPVRIHSLRGLQHGSLGLDTQLTEGIGVFRHGHPREERTDGRDALPDVTYSGKVDLSKAGTYEVMYELEGEKLALMVQVV